MASFNIHLAVGKRYVEKQHNILDLESFYLGVIAPDLVKDKVISHYGRKFVEDDITNNLRYKVILMDYLDSNSIDSDYDKGVFLHLITDYLFFNSLLDIDSIGNNHDKFVNDLYYTYRQSNDYLTEKYALSFDYLEDKMTKCINENNKAKRIILDKEAGLLFTNDELDEFISWVSGIDLLAYREKILANKTNIMP